MAVGYRCEDNNLLVVLTNLGGMMPSLVTQILNLTVMA